MHEFKIEATKFTIVGAVNFALTFIVFTVMLKVLGVNYLLSLVAAWVVGMLFSYALNFTWVFKPEQTIQFKARFFRFFLASVLSIVLNMLALSYIVERTDFDPFYIQMALIPIIVVFNFATAKFWSLRPSNNGKFTFSLEKFVAKGKWLDILSWIVIISFLIVFALGIFIPIYADEVSTKMTQATVSAGVWQMHTLIPQCRPDFALKIPISWYPAATIYHLLYSGVSPLGIRIISLATTFSWLALIVFWTKCTFPIPQYRLRLLAAMAAVVGLGVLPFTMILSRSEQWLLLLLTAFLVFPIAANRASRLDSRWISVAWFILFCIGISLFFYAHPKAVFFLPVVLFSAFYGLKSRSKTLFGLSVLFTAICAFQSVQFARELYRCEYAPNLSAFFASQTVNIGMLAESPLVVLRELISHLISAPWKIGRHLIFQKEYQSTWLPSLVGGKLSPLIVLVNIGVGAALIVTYFTALIVPPIVFFFARARILGSYRNFFIATLWIALFGHIAIYNSWNFYGGALVIPLAVLLLALSYVEFNLSSKRLLGSNKLLVALFVIFLTSSMVLVLTVVPRLVEAIHTNGDGLRGQSLSVPTFDFQVNRDRVRSLAKACNLQGDGARRLVVDDMTYFAFDNMTEPLHLVYLSELGMGSDIKNSEIKEFLSRMGSDGVIAQCTFLPPALKDISLHDGNICCVRLEDSTKPKFYMPSELK